MTVKQRLYQSLQTMSITTRFGLGIGCLLVLIVSVALIGYLSIFFHRSANNAIEVSTEIQRLVLVMDRGLEKARRLHADFFLQYPTMGFTAARELYAQPSMREINRVITTSRNLKHLIEQSPVSDAFLTSRAKLNLYLSSAERFSDTSRQSVELVAEMAAPGRGLDAKLDDFMQALRAQMTTNRLLQQYDQMRAQVQDYRISRQRHIMQSAFNIAFQIRTTIDSAPGIQAYQAQRINELFDLFVSTADIILTVDGAIKAKFNDFALQSRIITPISKALVELANTEVKQAQAKIIRTNKAVMITMVVVTLVGLVLAVLIARVLNNNITKRVVRLTATAGELRTGNLNALAEEYGKDEFSELARTFNVMAARIRALVNQLELKVVQRTEALAESEHRFRDLFEHSSSGVAVYKPVDKGQNFIFQDINKAVETIEKVKREEIIGKRVTEVFPAVAEFGLLDVLRQVAQTGQSARHPAMIYSDGRLTGWRENSVYKLPSGEVVAVYDDLTAQKQAEFDKEAMESQLHQARKMEAIGVLAGGIAHDFNNILGIILGNTELAIEDITQQDLVASNLEEIRIASLRAKEIIRQLLSFSRKSEIKISPVPIIPVIKDSLSFMRATMPAHIAIQQDISKDCGTVIADPTQIHQIIMNLCNNATHAMEESGGTLKIDATRVDITDTDVDEYPGIEPGAYLQLTVSDTGCGIKPEIMERVFEPYFTTKAVGKGSGMGLAVVHGIIQDHGGMITVESEPGQGSVFKLLLPAAEGKYTEKTPQPASNNKGNERILLIDDEAGLVKTVGSYLERRGYRVKSTTAPQDALDLFRANPDDFDLVITDMTMPKMSGVELSRKVLLLRSNMPIILCSGYSQSINSEKAESIGIRSYIDKPVKLNELVACIRNIFESDNTKRGN